MYPLSNPLTVCVEASIRAALILQVRALHPMFRYALRSRTARDELTVNRHSVLRGGGFLKAYVQPLSP